MSQVPEFRVAAVSGQNLAGIGVPLLGMDVYAGVDAPYGLMPADLVRPSTVEGLNFNLIVVMVICY